jgi:hypothetical protein
MMADGSSDTADIDFGNNGKVKVADLVVLGATLVGDEEKMKTGVPAHGVRLRNGAVLHNIIPPFPFETGAGDDGLWFAQTPVLGAVQADKELGEILANVRLSTQGKEIDSMPVHQKAFRGAAVCARKVGDAAAKADADLAAFYEAPTIHPTDAVSAMIDVEARNFIRSLKSDATRFLAGLADNIASDPKLERLAIGLMRSPLPLGTTVEKCVEASWRLLRERREPERLAALTARAELAKWARMVTDSAVGLVDGRARIFHRDLAKRDHKLALGFRAGLYRSINDDDFMRPMLSRFFDPNEAEMLRRVVNA